MDTQEIQTPIQTPKKKRFCCGAAKRLKDKCLRFHQDEEKCRDVILGHQECAEYKRIFEGKLPTTHLPS